MLVLLTMFLSISKIPKQEDIKLQWFKNIGREVKQYATVCSKHFKEENFCYTGINNIKRMLLPGAVPSLLLTPSNRTEENNPLTVSDKENCSNFEITENQMTDNCDFRENIGECGINDSPFSINSTENTSQSILKRNANEPKINAKRLYNLRNIGDLRREDFTSNASWQLDNNFAKKKKILILILIKKKKKRHFKKRINRLDKKVNNLQRLLDHKKMD
ncbi:uncharacterized protein LOC116851229 isoform X2 [Odontomachus brunneus]|uniref:uncharacterized protein LOC116851229 isoform X2 n=1 Tax=Odontomachus brunneus TaxID=486640 RepID=UPI0013F27292|nr:uncharacterized protein LOC116851229 isoform X2 [Odontomachus brunneus]